MITAEDIWRAELASDAYQAKRTPTWDVPDYVRAFSDVDKNGAPVVTFEGTRPDFASDWITDLKQLPLYVDPLLNNIPDGFGHAVLSIIFQLNRSFHGQAVGFNGHSMGASNALIAAVMWDLLGYPITRVTAFEPAAVGLLGNVLNPGNTLITDCGDDPVPKVVLWRPHPSRVTTLPNVGHWLPIGCHDIAHVIEALKAELNAQVS